MIANELSLDDLKGRIIAGTNNGLDVFRFYISGFKGEGTSFPSPLRPDKHPSFSVFRGMNGTYLFNDFGTGDCGDCFEFVMRLRNIDYKDAIRLTYKDLFLETKVRGEVKMERSEQKAVKYTVIKREMNDTESQYWNAYGITDVVMKRYNAIVLEEFTSESKEGASYTVKSRAGNPIFAYEHNGWMKVYQPLAEKKYKFLHLGTKREGAIFGWEQLPAAGDRVFITGGEKDVLTLAAHGYHAISLNSETANIDQGTVDELKDRFKEVFVLYDTDNTGQKQSELLKHKYGIHPITLPDIPNNGKDISDYFKQGGTKEELEDIISSATSVPIYDYEDKVVYTAAELLALPFVEPQYLMEPIFPRKGTGIIAGKPDTGKSQFARQLCISIAKGTTDFIGFKLKPIHNRSIYIATEDNMESTTYLLNKQIEATGEVPKENMRFIFGDNLDQEDLIKELTSTLDNEPADIVVIDSFGDIFTGSDTNNNVAMRKAVKPFDRIANKYGTLILFVHHTNKGSYRQAPKQENIQGGAGLVQKVRLAIQLSEGDDKIRYFSVVKGNYCPKEYKQNSLELEFSEETFLFRNTGRLVRTSEIGSSCENDKNTGKGQELERVVSEIFGDGILRSVEFVKKYCKATGDSKSTANRRQKELKESGFIIECEGGYRLSRIKDDDPSDKEEEMSED